MSPRAARSTAPDAQASSIHTGKAAPGEAVAFAREHEIADTELVFGLVGALGTNIDQVSELLHLCLEDVDYHPREIRLSALLREIDWDEPLDEKAKLDVYIASHMDAGDRLRREWERPDALALLGTAKIVAEREALLNKDESARRGAWVVRQLKTPQEVETLRNIYGSRFFLIAAYSPDDERAEWLESEITKSRRSKDQSKWGVTPEDLLKRDQSEDGQFGQNVRDTFHRADLFVDASKDANTKAQLERLLEIVLAHPFRSPTKDEFALFEAYGAARMSAEPGRQVGAALVNEQGEIIALGTNEVPRPGGGVYREGSNDPGIPDQREFRFGANEEERRIDTNDRMQREIAQEIADALNDQDRNWLKTNVDPDGLLAVILSTRLGDLTEFGRAIHAEMAAILDAARNGHAVAGASLYVTTFPCHNCARHIIGAGVRNCVFLAPYVKSQAAVLHSDALSVAKGGPVDQKVPFEPFVGVAPRRYAEVFTWARRKQDDGILFTWDGKTAEPRLADSDSPELRQSRPAYLVHEYLIMDLLAQVQRDRGLKVKKPPSTPEAPVAEARSGAEVHRTPSKPQKKPTRTASSKRKA
jgi:deoxycytidylate deaminase